MMYIVQIHNPDVPENKNGSHEVRRVYGPFCTGKLAADWARERFAITSRDESRTAWEVLPMQAIA